MVQKFINKNYEIVPFEKNADVYIVNTCTVTSISDKKSRQFLRKAKQQNNNAIVVAVGCYAEVAKEELAKVKEIDLVSDDERDSLYQAMKTLTHFIRNKEIMEEIEHEDTITNSIIFEDINMYLKDLSCFNEMMDMHRRYEYQLYKDDDFVMIDCVNK